MTRPLALALAAAALAGCHQKADTCSTGRQMDFVLGAARQWYLYQDLLPPTIDPAAYATPQDLLDALTAAARAQGKDRGWSYVASLTATQQYYGSGLTVGFGIVDLARGTAPQQQLFVGQVVAGSAAADSGFARGDEILAIGETDQSLVPAADLLATPGALDAAFGPAEVGVTRTFQVRTTSGATELRTASKRIYSVDPVPTYAVIPRDPLPPAGYLGLRTFIDTAEVPLRAAFAAFQAAGVTDLVVDVRYNGGGLISVAEILSNLLGAAQPASRMYQLQLSPANAFYDTISSFSEPPQPQAIAPAHVAFVTTGATASASELVPNVLDPYLPVALVGDRTYGKPVGQFQFQDPVCNMALFLISFRLVNSAGNADYFSGLPDPPAFRGPLCPAADDLTQPQESPLEASTSAALYWLENGVCPPAPAAALARVPTEFPRPLRPTPAQVDVPGLF